MLELREDTLIFQFPEVHEYAECKIDFQRTLRIPDDNRAYELPPGLGRFPIEHVEDHSSRLPEAWAKQGCVLLPMYQAEALWLNFSGYYPCAIKIAAGKINAVTGGDWSNDLNQAPQDYIVVPGQEWLDGFCVQKGLIRQFVAMPLGQGYTAEEQITGTAEFGGIQIIVYPMKREIFERRERARAAELRFSIAAPCFCEDASMGLAPGGLMHQEIYEDDYGFEQWDTSTSSR